MNNIGITWTSDQQQLIADMQKRQLLLEKELLRLQQLAAAGKTAGSALSASNKEAARSLAEQKAAALALDLQKRTAVAQNAAAERQAFQEQKLAAMSLARQKREALAETARMSREALIDERRGLKASAEQVRTGLMSERQLARDNYNQRMAHLHQLRTAGMLTDREFNTASKQALRTWTDLSRLDISKAWAAVPGQLQTALTLTGAIAAGVRLLRAEFDNMIKRQNDARDLNMTYAEARAGAIQSLDKTMTGAEFDEWIIKTSERTGQTPTFLARAAGGVLGAKQNQPAAKALEALDAVIPLERFRPEETKHVAASVLQQQKGDPGATFRQILGQQLAAKIASRVESSADFGQYVSYGAVAASAYGDSSKDFYTLAGYLANQGGDPSGQTSGTGAVDWQRDLMMLDKELQGGPSPMPAMGGSTLERLKTLVQNPKFAAVRERLMGGSRTALQAELGVSGNRMTARARAFGAILKIYQGDPSAWAELEGVGKDIPELGPQSEAFVDKQLKDLDSQAHRMAVSEQSNVATSERLKLANTRGGRTAVAKGGLTKNMEAAGLNWARQFLATRSFDVSTMLGADPDLTQAGLQRSAAGEIRKYAVRNSLSGLTPDVEQAARALEASAASLEAAVIELKRTPPSVNVVMPGAGEKPAAPAGAGLGAGGGQ